MDLDNLLSRMALALGIGLLIGLERGWRTREAQPGSRTAGIRTFAISGLLGGVIGAIAQGAGGIPTAGGGLILAFAFVVYSGVLAAFCRDENRADGTFSATTPVAGMLTFALGAYSAVGDVRVAAATAVAATGILAVREELHGLVEKITWSELRSGLVLLAMTFIGLPIVPDVRIGPFGGVNPREVWLIAIILAGVSFVGYAAIRYFGARPGMLMAAAAGGLVSSTAVTVANARRAAAREGSHRLLAAGVAVATAVSFVRVIAITAALKPALLALIAPSLAAAIAAAVVFAMIEAFWRAGEAVEQENAELRNPFGFWSVVGFALVLAAVIVFGRAVGESFGARGTVIGAIFVGLADVDSVTVSIANLTPDPLSAENAVYAILAAVASNTVCKIAIGAVIGRGRFAGEIAIMALGCFALAGAALWVTRALFA